MPVPDSLPVALLDVIPEQPDAEVTSTEKPDQSQPEKSRLDQPRPEATRPDQPPPDQSRVEKPCPDQSRDDQPRPEKSRIDQPRPDQSRAKKSRHGQAGKNEFPLPPRNQPQIAETVLNDVPDRVRLESDEVIDDPSILQSGIGEISEKLAEPSETPLLAEDDDVIDKISETNVSRNTSKSQNLSRQPSWLKPKVDYIPSQQWQLQGGQNSTLTSNRTVSDYESYVYES